MPDKATNAASVTTAAAHGDGNATAQGRDAVAVAAGGVAVFAAAGATVNLAALPPAPAATAAAPERYLRHVVDQNRYLQLQGIRSGGKLVSIELDRIYVSLRAVSAPGRGGEADCLAAEMALAPGERLRHAAPDAVDTGGAVSVNAALAAHRRLVVLGDPGSGKTTLLRYLALLYGRDLTEGSRQVQEKLALDEHGMLPIFLPLRQIGSYLEKHRAVDDGTEGHKILLDFLAQLLANERIDLPAGFFDAWLKAGRAAVLLDGLDEVADPALRRRVSRLVDGFTRAYPDCRYVVTSRIVGYTEAAQLAAGYATTTVREFTLADVASFLGHWHTLVAVGEFGPGLAAEAAAAAQTRQLLDSIEQNDRVRELAINPLMLTVIALIHRGDVKLPDRRAELYREAVDVLLGKWDNARGVKDALTLNGRPFDISDRRLVLQHLALAMHEAKSKEIDAEPLRELLAAQFGETLADAQERDAAVARFLKVIEERSGLLIARAEGTYAFSHLTFQEYLAALAIAGRDDYVDYSLARSADGWWREAILLEAGFLSTQSKQRTTRLIRAIAEARSEPAPYHNLVLAAECVRDAGANRIVGDLEAELRRRLQGELETPVARGLFGTVHAWFRRGMSADTAIRRRIAAAEALGQIGGGRFWTPPFGEPEWVLVPAGEFTMGEGDEAHRVDLPEFRIARIPVTNAQYQFFVQATDREPPEVWNGRRAPRGREGHPVVGVTWHDALAYCAWLGDVTGQAVALPSEAEWEKAARGAEDARAYPWGEAFDAARCNVWESGFGGTTPAGIFANGASPYGCLDMAGNVWGWTRSLWGKISQKPDFGYPYDPADPRREDLDASDEIVRFVRGGSWGYHHDDARCAIRNGSLPGNRRDLIGFRVVLRSSPVFRL